MDPILEGIWQPYSEVLEEWVFSFIWELAPPLSYRLHTRPVGFSFIYEMDQFANMVDLSVKVLEERQVCENLVELTLVRSDLMRPPVFS